VLATPQPKVYRKDGHFFGPNMTMPKGMQNMGSINVKGYGEVYICSNTPNNVAMQGNGFQLHGGGRVYFCKGVSNDFSDPFMYWDTNLANNHFAYTIDVSNVPCKCNAAMYWVNMPGYEGTNPTAGPGGDWYCDANFVNDNWCPEYDTFEGNAETMNVAIHTCDYVPPNDYSNCDRAGCGTNACVGIGGQYGRGRHIDTTQPYLVSHAQIMSGEKLQTSNHYFAQNGKTTDFNACNDFNYMQWMGYDLPGIVGVFSLWDMGNDESWLDGCTGCGGSCNLGAASVTFSGFELASVYESPNPKVREMAEKYKVPKPDHLI